MIENACIYGGGAAAIHIKMTDPAVEIHIEDDGPGIAADMLERVFEPYVRGDPSRGTDGGPPGTGLGLPIARNIIQSHGGTVTLRRRANGGMAAVIILPR